MLGHALAYGRRGWPVLPVWWPSYAGECACPEGGNCSSPAKHPLVPGGHLSATTNREQIAAWWASWPHASIAIATGQPAGFSVLDIDPEHGGQQSFSRMMKQSGRPDPTLVSLTGGGGRHILWRWMPEHRCSQNVRAGIDVRSSGGYILAPPSLHASGVRYEWHDEGHPRSVRVGTAPDWIEALLRGQRAGASSGSGVPSGPFAEGERNRSLFQWACRWQRQNVPDVDLADRAHSLNVKACRPPLSDKEVEKIVGSALRYAKGS